MKKNFVLIFLGLTFFIFAVTYHNCGYIIGIFKIRSAKARVHAVLKGIQLKRDGTGTIGDEQLAICCWYADVAFLRNMAELGQASDAFERWKKQANIFPYINSYTISEINPEESREPVRKKEKEGTEGKEEKEEKKPFVFIVKGTIDSATFIMRVPEGKTITWIQTPW